MIDNWANENIGSIELSGNLAAVGQRHLAIQQQIRQIAALQSLAELQMRQQVEKQLLEERQNILYDMSAALDDLKKKFESEPAKAYFEFLILAEFVSSLGIDHREFPSLEWKKYCTKTLDALTDLRSWCEISLPAEHRELGASAFNQRKRLAEEEKKREVEERERFEQANVLASKLDRRASLALVLSSVGVFFPPLSIIALVASILVLHKIVKSGIKGSRVIAIGALILSVIGIAVGCILAWGWSLMTNAR